MKKVIHRISTQFTASFNRFCDRIENHEAVAQSLLEDAQKARARFRVRLKQVQRDTQQLRERITHLEDQVQSWKDRALSIHQSDRAKALECVKRSQRAEANLAEAKQELVGQERIEQELTEGVDKIERRMEELRRRKHTFSARELRAQALQEQSSAEGHTGEDIEALFDRWDIKITEAEYYGEPTVTDSLECEFQKTEEQETLSSELDAWVEAAHSDAPSPDSKS